jgi:DNA-binding HxlR family transcriptional regulator
MSTTSYSCGLDTVLAVLGGKWKPLILFHLSHGVHRYGELKRAVEGVSDKVLIQQLKELQMDEVIERIDYKQIPPKVEYSLTAFGLSLAKALAPLVAWGVEHISDVERIGLRRRASFDAEGRQGVSTGSGN